MTPDREKTKSELLRELESIQSLLDDQDIPMLSEVIDKLSPANHPPSSSDNDRPLNEAEYAHLRKTYKSIKQEVTRYSTHHKARETTQSDATEEENLELDLGTLPTAEAVTQSHRHSETDPHTTESHLPLAGQQALFTLRSEDSADDPDAQPDPATTAADAGSDDSQPSKTRQTARSGENPFLPQHIRERLRGNRAGDFPASMYTPKAGAYTRKQLVDELVDSLLPEIEQALRLKLAGMSDEQIKGLLDN